MSRVRVFLSFDPVHDGDLRARLLSEAEKSCSGFEIFACSETTAMTEAWTERVRRRIVASDEVIVICGEHTQDSVRAATEIRIAQEEQKPYFLLWGRREVMCTKPIGARPSEGMYSWTPAILREQISVVLRSTVSRDAAERLRRR
jgi:hypothetical protein